MTCKPNVTTADSCQGSVAGKAGELAAAEWPIRLQENQCGGGPLSLSEDIGTAQQETHDSVIATNKDGKVLKKKKPRIGLGAIKKKKKKKPVIIQSHPILSSLLSSGSGKAHPASKPGMHIIY